MSKNLKDFIASLPLKEQEAIAKESKKLIAEEMSLKKLREAREHSQKKVGELLHINQSAVSKLERRTDMYVSILRDYVQAMGGTLNIVVAFPDHSKVKINQFEDLSRPANIAPKPSTTQKGKKVTGKVRKKTPPRRKSIISRSSNHHQTESPSQRARKTRR